ncbi:immunoglobulin superfamily member 5 isoform X2 [Gadus macrocephalus]|uniref:immunoglobulin superfamily member 5 isoform X2 n=1 Tax=Gadus macrocephalus TaxID=80720 RepID=UPI0028CB6CDD|nr:immunoglobulin superfamily member 5 isoform X2 [Gadus macrocephalus]
MVNIVFLAALVVLSFLTDGGCQMQLEPQSLTVLRGSEARLTCSTSEPWSVMVWLLNGASLLTISSEHGALPSGDPNVTAVEGRGAAGRSSWVLVLQAAARRHRGQVTCDIQGEDQKTASLFVQEKGSIGISGGNRTVLQGHRVRLECAAANWFPEPWVGWRVNGVEVSPGDYNVSRVGPSWGLVTMTSDLGLRATESSLVECLASVTALAQPLSSRVHITVVAEVLQGQGDCTVLLTATAVLSSLLLFLLLSVCIVCSVLCCRRRGRTKSNTKGTIRFNQSGSGLSSVAEAAGKVNPGYAAEGLPDDSTKGIHGQTDSVTIGMVPDVVSSRGRPLPQEGGAQVDLSEVGPKNVRVATTV